MTEGREDKIASGALIVFNAIGTNRDVDIVITNILSNPIGKEIHRLCNNTG